VIGDGPELKALKRLAGGQVEFLGKVTDEEMSQAFSECKALLFPGQEDFGIVPVEVQSFGRPIIAYASGGALETVRGASPGSALPDGATGVFFREQTLQSLEGAMLYFEENEKRFNAEQIRNHALTFDSAIFKRRFGDFVATSLEEFRQRQNV
jgi:glycosyltransferase involved in cell wall biosynthesis